MKTSFRPLQSDTCIVLEPNDIVRGDPPLEDHQRFYMRGYDIRSIKQIIGDTLIITEKALAKMQELV